MNPAAAAALAVFLTVYATLALVGRARSSTDGRAATPNRRTVRAMVSVHLSGDTLHVVPGDVDDHVVERTGECGCRPGTTRARGGNGQDLLFVDHHRRH